MRALRPMRSSVSLGALAAAIALTAPEVAAAAQACGNYATAQHYFVGGGQSCTVPTGNYNPTPTGTTILPFNDPGYGLVTYGGGVLTTNGAVTITPPNATGASGIYATGAGSSINTSLGQTVTVSGANTSAVEVLSGALVTLGAGTISVQGANSNGLYATGAGSKITAAPSGTAGFSIVTTGVGGNAVAVDSGGVVNIGTSALMTIVSTSGYSDTSGIYAQSLYATGANSKINATNLAISSLVPVGPQVLADKGATINFNGGSIATTGRFAVNATSLNASTITISNATLSATGNGAQTIYAANGGTVAGAGLTITATGGYDSTTQIYAGGASNNAASGYTTAGGTLKLSNSSITASGAGSYGVYTADGGTTTLTNTTVSATGANGVGVQTNANGQTTISGGAITAAGTNTFGLWVNGANAVAATTNLNISTSGDNYANAVLVQSGGVATVTGGTQTTSGAGAYVAAVIPNGTLKMFGVNLTATGAGSGGVTLNGSTTLFSGDQLTIKTSAGYYSTLNSNSFGLYNGSYNAFSGGGTATLSNSSILTAGVGASGVKNIDGGRINLTNVQITTSGAAAKGLSNFGTGSVITGSGLTITTSGGVVSNNKSVGVFNGNGGGDGGGSTGGGTINLTNSNITTSGYYAFGVATLNGGSTSLTGGSIKTSGVLADGVYGSSAGATTLSGVTVTTTNNGAKGISLHGTGSTLTGTNLTISTAGTIDTASGFNSEGVYNGSGPSPNNSGNTGGGTVTLTDTSVATSGVNAHGVQTANNGVTNIYGGAIATSGGGAVALLSQSGAQVAVGLDPLAAATQISTSGLSAAAVNANSGGAINLTGATVKTTAAGSTGLVVRDAGSSLIATNVSVVTSGGIDSNTGFHANAIFNGPGSTGTSGGTLTLNNVSATAAGFESAAVSTSTGGTSKVTGGTFSTSGENAAAMHVTNSGQLLVSGATLAATGLGSPGLVINGTGGSVAANNLSITTTGEISTLTGSHADGVYNGGFGSLTGGGVMTVTDTSVKTAGTQAYGVSVGAGGTTTFLGGAVSTQGAGANAAIASGGGVLTLGPDAAGKATLLSTSGLGAYALNASGGSHITINGAQVSTSGDGSGGLGVNSAGSQIDATGVTITTTGGYDATASLHAYGAANTPHGSFATGGVLNLTNSTISTQGAAMYGVYAGASSTTTISGGSVSTSGGGAHALYATGAGANMTANGVALSTSGANAFGAYVGNGASLTLGGGASITTTGVGSTGLNVTGAGSVATIASPVSINVGPGALGLSADNGGAIVSKGALTINSVGTALTVLGGAAPGSISFGGPLTITTTSATVPAILLTGDNATFNGGAGGTINAAGLAVALLNGVNQSATFLNYTINNVSGDLFFADPTTATLNFTNTTVNAGAGNLVNATAGSAITVNASNSALTGAVATDATSTTSFNLTNASSLTLTANSTITNLNLANSALSFSNPTGGAFKTLTVTNFVGNNGAVTLNVALGAGVSDKIIINGGAATGVTTLSFRPVGAAGATTGPGIPVVVATNGGTVAPGAFTLAGPLVVNGYLYTLQAQGGGDNLVSTTTQTQAQGASSLAALSQSRQTQAVTSRVLGSILTGATEQINCSSCQSGFASLGSFALGMHGRWTLSPSLALLAGGSYDSYSGRGVTVNNSMQFALALRYDAVALGKNRPFVEGGLLVQPWASVTYSRAYASALGGGVGTGTALSRSVAAYGRVGYIWRLTRTDEAAVYTDITRSWDSTSGYTESATPGNPNGATVSPTLDTLNVWRTGAQFTHLFGEHIEGNLSGGFAQAFGAAYGTSAALDGFGVVTAAAPTGFHWWELGGRVSYRFSKIVTGDLFLLGTLGAQPVGDQLHGGAALRMAF